MTQPRQRITVGEVVALYLQHVGIEEYFTVPGDFNLLLLDEMMKNKIYDSLVAVMSLMLDMLLMGIFMLNMK
jgi:hypothetical protein